MPIFIGNIPRGLVSRYSDEERECLAALSAGRSLSKAAKKALPQLISEGLVNQVSSGDGHVLTTDGLDAALVCRSASGRAITTDL
jgi:hypothetical protein